MSSLQPGAEKAALEAIAADSWYAKGANAATILYSAKVFARHWRLPSCLEMGPAEGLMTDLLVKAFPDLSVVEGSEKFCEDLKRRHPGIRVRQSLFESFEPGRRFETIVLGHVLEHVEDPVVILKRVREWLEPEGVVCAAVPSSGSIHRQAAVLMGLLPRVDALNETDRHHGHRRVYNPASFRADVEAAGLRVRVQGGYWIKPLSNAQIEATWTPEMLEAFMKLGEQYPELAAETYVIAGR